MFEIGCVKSAFARYFFWIRDKMCVVLYYVGYKMMVGDDLIDVMDDVWYVVGDFVNVSFVLLYDLCFCM